MKYIVRILALIVVCIIGYGYFLKNTQGASGDKWIGIGVLVLSLVLLPVFLYHRYRNKKITDFQFNLENKAFKKPDNQ
jgi:hypothetical protein